MTPETVNGIALTLFVAGLMMAVVSTTFRLVRLRRAGIPRPVLIWRDLAVFGLLAGTFALLLAHRAAGLPFVGELWWALLTAGAAVLAIGVYVYYELVVIGHRRDGPPEINDNDDGSTSITTHGPSTITVEPEGQTPRPETQNQREDRQFGEERRSLEQKHRDER